MPRIYQACSINAKTIEGFISIFPYCLKNSPEGKRQKGFIYFFVSVIKIFKSNFQNHLHNSVDSGRMLRENYGRGDRQEINEF